MLLSIRVGPTRRPKDIASDGLLQLELAADPGMEAWLPLWWFACVDCDENGQSSTWGIVISEIDGRGCKAIVDRYATSRRERDARALWLHTCARTLVS